MSEPIERKVCSLGTPFISTEMNGVPSKPVPGDILPCDSSDDLFILLRKRHVELDKIGRGKRIVKPPGGECSDIFGASPATSPNGEHPSTPRKSNKSFMLHSNIFTPPDSTDSTPTSPNGTNGKLLDTTVRLFGGEVQNETPRKVVDRQRSSIFEDEVDSSSRPGSVKNTPARKPQINPITGIPIHENGTNGHSNGTNGVHSNGGTPNGGTPNGTHSNGGTPNGHSNGYSNGHTSPDSPMNGSARAYRNPPGGKSSGIF
ncbi:hypothetical protein JTE90_003462 [Oedothorax gibbosus]|uniref:Microtubule-associated protein Jupiter n=1 Tax=Oedothorax gibbosus TaxID=931172 RepID=A0AAV6U3E0_9ARAC|nr:hypothetical protein JTE90_003462 [Oedothorax gibbosus]